MGKFNRVANKVGNNLPDTGRITGKADIFLSRNEVQFDIFILTFDCKCLNSIL
jgi:hypothetical protein